MLDNPEQEPNEQTQESPELLTEPTEAVENLQEEVEAEEFFQLGDEEVPLSKIEEWRKGHMMQSDYTRKTQELADQRKAFEAQKQQAESKAGELTALASELESDLMKEIEAIDWDDYTLSEAKAKEKELKAKKEKIDKAKQKAASAKQEVQQDQVLKEREKLFAANPDWLDNGQPTEKFQADQKAIVSQLSSYGFNANEINGITDHRILLMAKKAAMYDASKNKAVETREKVAKAPKVTKPRKGTQTGLDLQLREAQARLKRTGLPQDYMAVQKLKKQLSNG